MHFSIINWGPNNITLTNFIPRFEIFYFTISNQKIQQIRYLKINNLFLEQDRFESIYKTISSFDFK